MDERVRPVRQTIRDATKISLVYFMETRDRELIRIGFTERRNPSGRTNEHESYGHRVLAFVPAHKQDETKLHEYFSPHRAPQTAGETSHYHAAYIRPYIAELLECHFAASDIHTAVQLSRCTWSSWSPKALLTKPITSHDQICLFRVEGARADVRDTWQTPADIADLCREVFGGCIDLDPASCQEANSRVQALYFYDEKRNGLIMPWHGNVFLNPPYQSAGGAEKFIDKLIYEFTARNVRQAITVLNLQSVPTLWFPKVRKNASAHAIFLKRIRFFGPLAKSGKSPAYGASKNGTIFSYFGTDPSKFLEVFSPHAMVFSEWRAD